jgi:hypothetical protein
MTRKTMVLGAVFLAVGAAAAGAAGSWLAIVQPWKTPPAPAPLPVELPTAGPPIDAERIQTGRLSVDRMPDAVTQTLETHTTELIRTQEILQGKQTRIVGTCAPGSAIRVISGDGSVACQRLPRGVVSVAALAGVPRLSSTVTAQGSVPGGAGRFQERGEDDFLVVPVALPDGAVVTAFTYVFFDADEAVDGVAYLYRSDDQPMAAASTAGAEDAVRVATTEEIQLGRVDAARYAYFVYFQTSAAGGANLLPISASVAYRLP